MRTPKNKTLTVRTTEKMHDLIYKIASNQNLSINEVVNRMINNSLIEGILYFEFQYLLRDEKFILKNDTSQTVYTFVACREINGFKNFEVILSGGILNLDYDLYKRQVVKTA